MGFGAGSFARVAGSAREKSETGVRREGGAFQWVQASPGNSSRKQRERSWRQRNGSSLRGHARADGFEDDRQQLLPSRQGQPSVPGPRQQHRSAVVPGG